MFTVIIADKETIELFEETKMFFGSLYDKDKIGFCEWDREASSFEAMLPELYEMIEYRESWRAVILNCDGKYKLNPFDYTGYTDDYRASNKTDWQLLNRRRMDRFACYEKALSNPLLKLTTALCGKLEFTYLMEDKDLFEALVSEKLQLFEYMLRGQLSAINCAETAARIDKFERDKIVKFVSKDKVDLLIEGIKNSDASEILSLVSVDDILDFIRYIGNDDPFYSDPEFSECLIENTMKVKLSETIREVFISKDRLPTEVICVSPRTFDFEKFEQNERWNLKDEHYSSRFTDFNLYSNKLKFMVFDILPDDNKQYKFDRVKLACFLLMLGTNELPNGVVGAGKVYRANIGFDSDMISEKCRKYLSKLRATEIKLKEITLEHSRDMSKSIDNATARELFESDIKIPVHIDGEYKISDLYAKDDRLGLAEDCPEDENVYWANQYRGISKRFVRYLREPRRALKTAVSESFRDNNKIDDDRALQMNENQIEDVNYRLQEEEQNMVETSTTQLFNTTAYTNKIDEADKHIKKGIAQRMSKKKTIITGLIAVGVYLIGFLPLIFGSLNTVGSFLFSLLFVGAALLIFSLCGLVYLFVLRKRLKDRFKHFNYVMGGICKEIQDSLNRFSKYISCACNVMREFSVLKMSESKSAKKQRILDYHKKQIEDKVKDVHEMFSRYVNYDNMYLEESEPYDYDFTVLREYEYRMPDYDAEKTIEFMQVGNFVKVPVNFIETVTITREELYD